ncbi:MAG: hypothetical protein LJF30_23020 [Acidobacteria bacterium]|nr:hypothetical protein [Acidobacteriota bacterium]
MRRPGDPGGSASRRARAALLAVLLVLVLPAAASPPASEPEALAWSLRGLYPNTIEPWERWRGRPMARMPDGREVPRETAFRDDPAFAAAAEHLLASGKGDDAPLGAWLLGTVPATRLAEVEPVLLGVLSHSDRRAGFEAAMALAEVGGAKSRDALARAARTAGSAEVRAAAAWSAQEVGRRLGEAETVPLSPVPADGVVPLAPAFRRGVSWWLSEGRGDDGRSSFRSLAALGVTWVSIHTWDPLQNGLYDPVLSPRSRRFGVRNLQALVANAHSAGLAVLFKPHLEMRGYRPTPEERRILRGPDPEARHRVIARIEALSAGREHGGHNRLSMRTDADWARWFESYQDYILPYARDAQAAGADMFCVGRELDSSMVQREADWRRLIARIRDEFDGPLVYSANFDSWDGIQLWDALDFIGVSAYFPLSDRADPSLGELEAGWARALEPLEAASKRWGRPVLLTEAGFPSIASAARSPWKEEKTRADVWLQSRCYEATLRALADRPWIEGAFFWLWERSSEPAFRDPSHTIKGKPAMFVMGRWYEAGRGRS